MSTSVPREASCPGCFKRVSSEAAACAACGAAVWADGRLLIVGPMEEGRAGMFRGLLRTDGDASALEEVAVKVLDVGGLPDWRDYERFRRQGDILGSLSHPRIPRARGDLEVGSRVLHCQTLVAGRSLARLLRGARMSPAEVTRLADELLQVLDYLHGRDVVHRDVKPDNVVIAADGGAHLVDFGAARRLHATGKLDAEPTVVGTPGYMAPEQTRGEAMPQSDLYALGRLLTEALGGAQPEQPLAGLLPLLCREDWRKRPASAAAALELLRPRIAGARRNWWPIAAAASVALVAVVGAVRMVGKGKPAAPGALASVAEDPVRPSLSALASALLYEWSLAQHARDIERYGRCYAPDFKGVRRTPGGKVLNLDRTSWLADRARIYAQPVEIQTADLDIVTDDVAGTAVITLLQRFRRGNYAEHGHKRFTAKLVGSAMLFTSEEMLDSKRGWDEDEYASQVPMQASDCKVAFDPSNHEFAVVLSSHDDYAEALRAAAKERKAKRAAEIVWGPAFTGLGPGFWVLAGAVDDEDKAAALATRTGGEVKEVTLAPQPSQGITRLIARRTLPHMYEYGNSARMITVVGSTAYAVLHDQIASYALGEPELPNIRKLALPTGVKLVRIVERKGAAHLLDAEGHWHRIGEQIERVPSFDPDDSIGKRAKFKSVRFELDDHVAVIFVARQGESSERLQWPLAARERALFAVGDDRLAVFRDGELFVFAVGQPTPRLTKLCINVTPGDGYRIKGPAGIAIGGMQLVTDRAGKLDVWTDEWGFIQPELSTLSDAKPVIECGEDEDLSLQMSVVPLFRQTSVTAEASATCEAIGC